MQQIYQLQQQVNYNVKKKTTLYRPFWWSEDIWVESWNSKVCHWHKNSNETNGRQHRRLPIPHLPIHNNNSV